MESSRIVFVPGTSYDEVAQNMILRGYTTADVERRAWTTPGSAGDTVNVKQALVGNKGLCYYVDMSAAESERFSNSCRVQVSPTRLRDVSTQTPPSRPPSLNTDLRAQDDY